MGFRFTINVTLCVYYQINCIGLATCPVNVIDMLESDNGFCIFHEVHNSKLTDIKKCPFAFSFSLQFYDSDRFGVNGLLFSVAIAT